MTNGVAFAVSEALLREAWQSHRAGDFARAEQLYKDILRKEPKNFDVLYRLGFLYGERGQFEDAQSTMGKAITLEPGASDAHFLRGSALLSLERNEEAIACFDGALALDPEFPEALFNRAVALIGLGRYQEALASADRSLALAPNNADALVSKAVALKALMRIDEAMASYDKALAIKPDCIDALVNRGTILFEMKRYEEAARDCERALALDPELDYMRGFSLYFRLQCCDWEYLARDESAIAAGLKQGRRVIQPLMNLALSSSPAEQLQCARIWASSECAASGEPLWRGERYNHERIKVAYLSEDFRVHPVAQLMAGVLEHHDRSRFEITAVSLGPNDNSALRARVMRACERFIDVSGENELEVAKLLKGAEIDIAVDLTGFTGRSRSRILPQRPAGVQVSYLGFPATMGGQYIDYILADRIVIREDEQCHYSEKVVYLPGTYMASDSARAMAERTPARAEAGLPEEGFVFACFNGPHKISPPMFDVWMRLLCLVEASVLWLPQGNPAARRNLAMAAEARGVRSGRLVFAPRLPAPEDHLARLRLADLFLDTLPYGAHTSACDALWAGLPVLTSLGATFAGRVAASLLHAIGLPELVTHSLADYEAMALNFARDRSALAAVKAKLVRNRDTYPLFDTARFTRAIEAAYATMWERSNKGLPPAHFAVGQGK